MGMAEYASPPTLLPKGHFRFQEAKTSAGRRRITTKMTIIMIIMITILRVVQYTTARNTHNKRRGIRN